MRQKLSSRAHRQTHSRLLILGTVITLALVVSAFVGEKYNEVLQSATDHVVEIGATYRAIPSVDALTQQAIIVVIGHVVGKGNTTLVLQQTARPQPARPAPTGPLPGDKAHLIATQAKSPIASSSSKVAAPTLSNSIPVTTYTFQVTQVLRGNVNASHRITLKQPGGPVTLPTYPGGPQLHRTFVFEHDPLMVANQEQMLFLTQTPDGSYMVVGGPQGRFLLQNGTVRPIDPTEPLARNHQHDTVGTFITRVKAVR